MNKIAQLEEMIERERQMLDGVYADGEDYEACCRQSRKLDDLINEYYQLVVGN